MTSTTTSRRQGVNSAAAVKVACRAASIGNLTLTGEQTVDSVALVTGDRVLVKNQTNTVNNGIYIVDTGDWSRSKDFDGAYDIVEGTMLEVLHGSTNGGDWFQVSTVDPVIETSAIAFTRTLLGDASAVNFTAAGTGAQTRTAQDKERDIVSVKDFGAIGDGAANDTTPFNRVEALASTVQGIFVPNGTYSTTLASLTAKKYFGPGTVQLTTGDFIPDRQYENVRVRTKPTGFSFVPGSILDCEGPGLAKHDIDLEKAFRGTYSAQMYPTPDDFASSKFVDPINGSDANAGTFSAPYATLKKAYQSITAGSIYLKRATYTERWDLRFADNNSGGLAKAIQVKAWEGLGSVTFRAPGQQPNEMTWTVSVGTTYTATPSGSEVVSHIIYNINGKEIDLEYKTSSANVDASTNGYYQDPATKAIYIRFGGVNINDQGIKDGLEIMYERTVGSLLVLGAVTYMQDIIFRGDTQFVALYSGANRGVLYAKRCKFQYMQSHQVMSLGAICFAQDCISERAQNGDGFKYDEDTGTGTNAQGLEIDCIGRNNGISVSRYFIVNSGTDNIQGSSAHDGSFIARINGVYEGNYGQNIADTINSAGGAGAVWMVGTECRTPSILTVTVDNLSMQGTSYLDNVFAASQKARYGLYLESGVGHLYRCQFNGATASIGANTGTHERYNPTTL